LKGVGKTGYFKERGFPRGLPSPVIESKQPSDEGEKMNVERARKESYFKKRSFSRGFSVPISTL